jgi:predicted metallo-beta-lactamase superfamily hydrolase
MKNPRDKINASQRERAWIFQKTGGKYAKKLESADGKAFAFGSTLLRFSEAVVHGSEDAILGWVIMAIIEHEGERFMFAPDIQGPMSKHTFDLILEAKSNLIMLGGPPLYLAGTRVDMNRINEGLSNLESIVEAVPTVIVEHHALRDEDWKQKTPAIYQKAQATSHRVMTAAEYAGNENFFLEFKRKQLYRDFPPSEEFKQWMKTLNNEKIAKPPI